jgi:sigma-B regulation protein RsbU (phosphoserine phosphatase)
VKKEKYQHSIYAKVRRKMIFAALLSALAVFVVATVSVFFIRDGVANVNKELGNNAANNSMNSMAELTETALMQTAHNRALLSDDKMQTVSKAVRIIASGATAIMSHPGRYRDRSILPPDSRNDGKLVAQVVYAADVVPSELAHEVGLLGNLQDLQIALLDTEDTMASMQIGSETGIMVMVDEMSGAKTSPFDPRERPWYTAAKEEGGLIWTDVFDDAFGRGLSITCGMPYYNADGKIEGVVSAGMLLKTLNDTVAGARVGESGKTFIVNETGDILISEDIAQDEDGNIIRENLFESDSESMRDAAKKMTKGESGIEHVILQDKEYFMAYSPLTVRPWSFAVLIETEEVLAPAEVTRQQISAFTGKALGEIQTIFLVTLGVFIFLLIGIVLFEIRFSKSLSTGITAPIITLTREVRNLIDREDFNLDLHIETGDEIEELADAFSDMTVRLREHIRNLTIITEEKGRIETELNVARRIQASMLPCIFPPFPDRREFEIYAIMQPAKEVGGDFYDFFLINRNTLCVVISDVSGKGVPAALFMIIAKTLIKNNAQTNMRLSEVFRTVNNLLCENNEEDMFVTAFMGYLDIPTGRFRFVNAGHNPPIVNRGDGFRPIKVIPGFVLGGMTDIQFSEGEIDLNVGDTVCMYTDGVTEAVNGAKELYSLARLIDVADRENLSDLTSFTLDIKSSVESFQGDEEQADDITLLSFRYAGQRAADGPEAVGGECGHAAGEQGDDRFRELEIDADTGCLRQVLTFISEPLRARGVNEMRITQVETAAEEVFVNIASYACAPECGKVRIKYSFGEELVLVFEDEGRPFDPISAPDPDTDLVVEERKIGGLGIYITKKIMDVATYRRENGKNILTLRKRV